MAFFDDFSHRHVSNYWLSQNSSKFYVQIAPLLPTVFLRPINPKTSKKKTINFNKNIENVKKLSFTKEGPSTYGHDDGRS